MTTRLKGEVLFQMHQHSSPRISFTELRVGDVVRAPTPTPMHQQETIMLESLEEEVEEEPNHVEWVCHKRYFYFYLSPI
jgi:ribosomal protein S10